jgi:hypothetical protein
MTNFETINEKNMDRQLNEWQEKLNDIDLELSMDFDELPEAFEKQKEEMQAFLGDSIKKLEKTIGEDRTTDLKAKMEGLQVQMALGRAESKEAFEEQRKKFDDLFHSLQQKYEEVRKDEEATGHSLVDKLDKMATAMRTRLEVLRLKYSLGKADVEDELEETRKEVMEKVNELRARWADRQARKENGEDDDDSIWDDIADEAKEAMDTIGSRIRGIFGSKDDSSAK